VQRTLVLVVLISCVLMTPHFVFGSTAPTCTQTFTPSTVGSGGSAVSAAVAGGNSSTVLCFAAGTYSGITITSAHPSGIVTLTPAPGAAVAMGEFHISNASNISITGFGCTPGVWINYGGASSCTSNGSSSQGITTSGGGVSNLEFSYNAMSSNGAEIRDNSANANIVLDHNVYSGFSALCETCRIHIFNNGNPMGVTVSYSYMAGGSDDGIQWGGNGLKLLNNEFFNLTGNGGGIHQDAMQGVGDSHSTIKGNYAHAVANCWQLTDGSSNLDMEDNVCIADGSDGHSAQICSQTLTFRHNTIASPYGINIGNDSNGSASSNVTISDNILNGEFSVNSGQPIAGTFSQDYNLCYSGGCAGSHSLSGRPLYVGGSTPPTYGGYALASASIGFGAASDGTDMGMNTTGTTGTGPTPPSPPSNLAALVQ
jgi:hypothetical protein